MANRRRGFAVTIVALVGASAIACGPAPGDGDGDDVTEDAPGDGDGDGDGDDALEPPVEGAIAVPEYEQRPGDAETGYTTLVNDGYIGCGVPRSAYDVAFGAADDALRLPGRDAMNEALPYDYNAFVDENGVEVVSATCLLCHATYFRGEVVVGLGNAGLDFTSSAAQQAQLAGFLVTDDAERPSYEKWRDRVVATAPYLVTKVRGVNPADNLAAILFAHRDADTLAWSDEPLLDPPPLDPLPVDVPPFWRVKKKHGLYYSAGGRGDHARLMMTASALCVDDVETAAAIDETFPDVRAFIESIEAPPFPEAVDEELAASGKELFESTCAMCHGTYGEGGSYPNWLIPVDVVGTDPLLGTAAVHFADRFVDWLNSSFYGDSAEFVPSSHYIAPPLDGIWATAPFLHNGSVPTLHALLDSTTRPTYFVRSFDSNQYDLDDVGWPYEEHATGHDDPANASIVKTLYDTTQPGYANTGHTFGDALSDEERDAVIAYLKTL